MMRICICGAGTMGTGIAQVCASAGFDTILYDVNESMIIKAKEKLNKDLQQLVDKKRISEEAKENIGQLLAFTSDYKNCWADVVIEAIIEKREAKIDLFNQLAQINEPETIFASNTSSLSISDIATGIKGPERVAGLHFFNPAPIMKLVEVVKGRQTAEAILEQLVNLTRQLGKEPVVCLDSPGFIVNRVARPYYIESLRLAEEEEVDFETIDHILENRGFKMGPFKLMDLIGNDINYAVSCSVYEQLNKPERLKPSFIQKQKVENGNLGKKTGKGYYEY
ncbi:MAG TPA: 3-hydroxyacyl-CoA dehydrogenase NAD-binding domain-containing protein [Flavisolibacter sp.]|nr:3-hydroxyacyl-CoA dehydrogenase NAD-binding domain-containing protein [Flavisolibacter sp.]